MSLKNVNIVELRLVGRTDRVPQNAEDLPPLIMSNPAKCQRRRSMFRLSAVGCFSFLCGHSTITGDSCYFYT